MGQFDIIPTLLVVAAIFFALQNKKFLAVAMLGVGGAFKMFPLLFLPLFALLLGKDFWHRIWLFIIGLLPYLVIISPYFLFSPMYRQTAFLTTQTEKMLYMKLPLSGAEYLSVFMVAYFVLLILATRSHNQKDSLWRFGLVLMLLFFAITHYHPQWFLWVAPFLVWAWLHCGTEYRPYLILISGCWFLITLFFEPSLHVGLFAPLAPNLLKLGSLADLVGRFYDVFLVKSLIRSFLAGLSLFLSFHLLSERKMSV